MGVGVWYFSSARARRIGSARPNSLNEVKESLSYAAKPPAAECRRHIRGFQDIPRGQGCRLRLKTDEAGRNSFSIFVHAARRLGRSSPSSVALHMTANHG